MVRAAQKQGLARLSLTLELRSPSTGLGVQPCGDSPVNKESVSPRIWGCLQPARQTQLLQREQTDAPRQRDRSTCHIDPAATRHTPAATARPPGPSGSAGKTSVPHGLCTEGPLSQSQRGDTAAAGTDTLGSAGAQLCKAAPRSRSAGSGGRSHGPPAAAGQDSLRDGSSKSGLLAGDPKESICSLFSA